MAIFSLIHQALNPGPSQAELAAQRQAEQMQEQTRKDNEEFQKKMDDIAERQNAESEKFLEFCKGATDGTEGNGNAMLAAAGAEVDPKLSPDIKEMKRDNLSILEKDGMAAVGYSKDDSIQPTFNEPRKFVDTPEYKEFQEARKELAAERQEAIQSNSAVNEKYNEFMEQHKKDSVARANNNGPQGLLALSPLAHVLHNIKYS